MKRDDDYLRELLFEMEAAEDYLFDPDGHTDDASSEERKKTYHCMLAVDAGLVVYVARAGHYARITSSEHDFIQTIRNGTTWNRTKAIAGRAGMQTIDKRAQIAVALGKQKVTERIGIELP